MSATVDPITTTTFALRTIRAEFNEMPGMRLTLRQAARLWRLPEASCRSILDGLVSAGFLARDATQHYRRFEPR